MGERERLYNQVVAYWTYRYCNLYRIGDKNGFSETLLREIRLAQWYADRYAKERDTRYDDANKDRPDNPGRLNPDLGQGIGRAALENAVGKSRRRRRANKNKHN